MPLRAHVATSEDACEHATRLAGPSRMQLSRCYLAVGVRAWVREAPETCMHALVPLEASQDDSTVRESERVTCQTQGVPKSLTRSQVDQLAESTRAFLDRIRSGELAARPETIHRLEGALVALQAVLRAPTDPLRALLEPGV